MRTITSIVMALLCGGCSLQMDLPPGFLRLHAQESGDLRAVTADDARVWVREFAVDDGASLEFWCEAFAGDLRQARGYELEDLGEVRDGSQHAGRAFRGSTVLAGERCGYFAAVFLLPGGWLSSDHIRVVEFAARQESFADKLDAVRAAVASLR